MNLSAIDQALAPLGVPVYVGYPATGARLPYVVIRPFLTEPDDGAIAGNAFAWDDQVAAYAAAGSAAASDNLGKDVIRTVHGAWVDGHVLRASLGYSGAQVEGHYETQVTIQNNRGDI